MENDARHDLRFRKDPPHDQLDEHFPGLFVIKLCHEILKSINGLLRILAMRDGSRGASNFVRLR